MMRTFNNGIGMIAVVPDRDVSDVIDRINEKAWLIGEIAEQKQGDQAVEFV